MKAGHWFTLCIVAFLGLMFAVEYSLPKKFVWTPTFLSTDRQPFGCALFDDLVMDAYSTDTTYLTTETFYQLSVDTTRRRSLLAIGQHLDLKKPDVNALLDMAHSGSRILLAAQSFGQALEDTLGFACTDSHFSMNQLRQYAISAVGQRDTLLWVGPSSRYFRFYPQLCGGHFKEYDSLATVLSVKYFSEIERYTSPEEIVMPPQPIDSVEASDSLVSAQPVDSVEVSGSLIPAVALSYRVGQGEIILVSTPLLFTNYGVTDGHNATYIFRLLSRLSDLPLYRTQAYGIGAQEQRSPLRYFLSQPALRWALYLTVITLVLFIFFTARRRQRPIPIIRKPENRTLEFAQLIGTLYYQRRNHADLVAKHFCYFCETLRRTAQLDAEDPADDDILAHRLAQKTGMDELPIRRLLAQLRPIIASQQVVTEEQMKHYIDRMNELTNHL